MSEYYIRNESLKHAIRYERINSKDENVILSNALKKVGQKKSNKECIYLTSQYIMAGKQGPYYLAVDPILIRRFIEDKYKIERRKENRIIHEQCIKKGNTKNMIYTPYRLL